MFVPHHASEIWSKSYGLSYTKFWAFWKQNKKTNKQKQKQKHTLGLFKPFWQSTDAILEDVSVAETIV